MKILFVLEYYTPHIGGAEVLFQNLCEGLTRKGYDITVLTIRLPGTEAFEMLNGVKVHRVKVPQWGARYWFTFLAIPKTFQFARQADLIHTTTYNGAFPAWLAARLRGKKAVMSVLEIFGTRWKSMTGMSWLGAKLHQLLERMVIALPFDRHISISRYTSKCLIDYGVNRYRAGIIYCGIDYDLQSKRCCPDEISGDCHRWNRRNLLSFRRSSGSDAFQQC